MIHINCSLGLRLFFAALRGCPSAVLAFYAHVRKCRRCWREETR